MEESHLSLSEAAQLLGISERTTRRWIKAGKLRAYKPGRDYRIPESAVTALIEESEVRPKAERRSSIEPSFNDVLAEEQREQERAQRLGELPGWLRAAVEAEDFVRRFEAAKSSAEHAAHLVAGELAEAERVRELLRGPKGAPLAVAEEQAARRDLGQANARFTAAMFLSVDVWREKDVSGRRAVDYVAEVASNQRALLASGELFAAEGRADAQAG